MDKQRDVHLYYIDIFVAVDKLSRYGAEFETVEDLYADEKAWESTIYQIEVIAAAALFLMKQGALSLQYEHIIDLKIKATSDYFDVNKALVWDIVHTKYITFEEELLHKIKEEHINILPAIDYVKEQEVQNPSVLKCLNTLRETLIAHDKYTQSMF